MSNTRPTFLALGAVLAVAGLAACGGSGGASPASTPSAPRTSPAATAVAAPVKAATSSSAACAAITRTISAVTADAQSRAKVRYAHLPAGSTLTEASLRDAYTAGDLAGSAQALAADERIPGITPALKAAEEEIAAAAPVIYANYGQDSVTAKYSQQEAAAFGVINRECP